MSSQSQRINLKPPTINSRTILQKIVCTRPMREGFFRIAMERKEEQHIIHCYGHGGAGWTTLFGSIKKAIELLKQAHVDKSMPIRILGAGCMGLTAAIELSKAGYSVSGITAKELYDIASWKAAGYFGLLSVKTSPHHQAELHSIGIDTFLTYQQIEQGVHPYITKEAVRPLPVYSSLDTESGVENLTKQGLRPPPESVTLDFGNGVTHPNFLKYMTYFINTSTVMKQLTAYVKYLKIPFEIKTCASFEELPEKVIVNCTGLGAQALAHDDKLIPVRGHLVTLSKTSGFTHMNYMVHTKVQQEGKEEYVYLFPKTLSINPEAIEGIPCAGVLGGTFLPNIDILSQEEQIELDGLEFKRLLDRNSLFFHGHRFQE